ncbi:MAG: tRNA pseudouridine(38-40) synthase TruA [Clostridia bacterium]|nr:tRNA pseudouridine(38-40) synthase TruA [Clostridia bacterium]
MELYERNLALLIRYDGTNYHGWQSQKNGTTVQEVLSDAILRLTGSSPQPELHGVGRTDAGVHAANYVANFHTGTRIPSDRFPLAIRPFLPEDIAVLAAADVPEGFHARYSCLEKTYCYRFYAARVPDPFLRNRAYFTPFRVDLDAMREGAAVLPGTHDFAAFRASNYTAKGSVRTVTRLTVEEESPEHFVITVSADGFLYNMVRIIAGTLFYVGIGKLRPEDVRRILENGYRPDAGITLPPHGLYLLSARYPAGTFEGGDEAFDPKI